MHEVTFSSDGETQAKMEIDQGYRFADLELEERSFHLFFNRDNASLKNARIVEPQSKLQIARGKGSYFWGNARFEFVGGEVYKIKRKKNVNGYEIIGPYGTLFKIENHAMTKVSTYNEHDFLAQAFFVFERIKVTQSRPSDVIIYTSNYYPVTSNK
ncbi:hypothetical protein GCM10009119_12050 [Algoriphagus jejuensis]|uniref:Uncharacterized protein n=2 Tax=Algoriphagus jejuensis TaxID=419934 RepID=A0ABP3YES6_9BACT